MQLRDNGSCTHGNRTANILLLNLPEGTAEQNRGITHSSSLIWLTASSKAIKSPPTSKCSKEPIHMVLQEAASGVIWCGMYWACARALCDQSTRKEKRKKGSVLWSQTDFSETHSQIFCILYILLGITVRCRSQAENLGTQAFKTQTFVLRV